MLACVLGTAAGASVAPAPAMAALAQAQRSVIERYLDALVHQRYDAAFALITPAERAYFGTAGNFASVFTADRLRITSFEVIGSKPVSDAGTLVIVLEHVSFFDHAQQRLGDLRANVRYGVVPAPAGRFAIDDPGHPWHAFAPADVTVQTHAVRATVRKISFFPGRLEVVVTFANYGRDAVTILPYGRSVLSDDAGTPHVPLATKLASLTNRTLYEGLRLAAGSQYTGALTFPTADRYVPKTLSLTISPAIVDGGDAPFELAIPSFAVPVSK